MFAKNKFLILLILIVSILVVSCKTNQMKYGKRDGVWIESYSLDTINNNLNFKSREVYRIGKPIRTWKYYKNNRIERKEQYKKDYCLVTYFYENGKVEKTGKTKIVETEKETHWFYDGAWEFFDENGKPSRTVYYELGQAIKTDSLKLN